MIKVKNNCYFLCDSWKLIKFVSLNIKMYCLIKEIAYRENITRNNKNKA